MERFKKKRMQIDVFKFGGASVRDAERIQRVVDILSQHRDRALVIVVSAMGKTTNALEEVVAAHAVGDTDTAMQRLQAVKQQHFQLMLNHFGSQEHEVFGLVNDLFVEAEWVLEEEPHENYDYMYDQVVSVGELVSTRILASWFSEKGLPTHWLDARDLIRTDNIYREGWVQWDETKRRVAEKVLPLLEKGGFTLTQGFIGSTSENFTTTLGREGSDYSAAIFSHCLDAGSMTIWKDVPGVLTADPRLFDNVTKLDELSYREAIEMTYYGAKVIHPKTIKPLQNKSIPLYVRSFLDPAGSGTRITADASETYPAMVAIEAQQAVIFIATRDFSFVAEQHMSELFKEITNHRLQVNMMQNTAISFAISVNDQDDKVERFARAIETDYKVKVERGLELITVRHYTDSVLESLKHDRIILLEERIRNTVQMVVKNVPVLKRREAVEVE